MKKLVLATCLFLFGCGADVSPPSPSSEVEITPTKPPYLVLQTEDNQFYGFAVPVETEVFLTLRPEDQKNPQIFWADELLEIRQQIIDRNALFLEIPSPDFPKAVFSDEVPIAGQTLYWMSDGQIRDGKIRGIFSEILEIEGELEPSLMSSPVFTVDGKVLGVLAGASPREQILSVQRTRPLLDFWETNK